MGVITSIGSQKNKKRVNLFVDGAFFCGVSTEVLLKNGLKVGSEVNEESLNKLILESETRKALDYAFDLVGNRPYSKLEIVRKLRNKGFEPQVCDSVIEKLKEYSLIDDLAYAKMLVKSNNSDGRRKIYTKLFNKGLDREDIQTALNDVNFNDEMAKIERISAKYMQNKEKNDQNLQKLCRYLLNKGFNYEQIMPYINKIREDFE